MYLNKKKAYIFVTLGESESKNDFAFFQKELLKKSSKKKPNLFDKLFTKNILKKNLKKTEIDYKQISFYENTQKLIMSITKLTDIPCFSFYLLLPSTHEEFFENIEKCNADEFYIFPFFPQFSYATTGIIASYFEKTVKTNLLKKFLWIKSYCSSKPYIYTYHKLLKDFIDCNNLYEKETIFLFTAHSIPENLINDGDVYDIECLTSFQNILKNFPYIVGRIGFHPFFFENNLKPTVKDICTDIKYIAKDRKNIIFIPFSSSLEYPKSLKEIELLFPMIEKQELKPFLAPSINFHPNWIKSILEIIEEKNFVNNQMLVYS